MSETIYRSPYPYPKLAEMSAFEYVRPNRREPLVKAYPPSKPAIIDGLSGRTLTRQELMDTALRVAAGLLSMGMKKGDTACIWGLNSIEWAVAAYACMAAGLTVTPANAA